MRRERDAWTALASAHGLGSDRLRGPARRVRDRARDHGGRRRAVRRGAADGDAIQSTPIGATMTPIHASVARAIVSAVENADQIVSRVRCARGSRRDRRGAGLPGPVGVDRHAAARPLRDRRPGERCLGSGRSRSSGRVARRRPAARPPAGSPRPWSPPTPRSCRAWPSGSMARRTRQRSEPAGRRWRSSVAGTPSSRPGSHARLAEAIIAGGGAVVSELAPDVATQSRHLSPTQPDHQRVERRNGRRGGSRAQRRAHHRVVGAGAGPAVLSRARPARRAVVGRLPRVPARMGARGPPRGGHPAAHRGPWLRRADPRHARRGRRGNASVAREGRGGDRGAARGAGHVTVDELVAVTDLPVASVLTALALLERRGLAVGVHGRYRPAGPLLGERVRIRLR